VNEKVLHKGYRPTKVIDRTFSPIAYQLGHVHDGYRIIERKRVWRLDGKIWTWIGEEIAPHWLF